MPGSIKTRTQFDTKYNSSGAGSFPDNNVQAIIESIMREFAEEIKLSTVFNLDDVALQTVDVSSSTITFNMNSQYQRQFKGSATIAGNKTIAFSNTSAMVRGFFRFTCQATYTLTFPAGTGILDWDGNFASSLVWTCPTTGVYEAEFTYDGTNINVKISGCFIYP